MFLSLLIVMINPLNTPYMDLFDETPEVWNYCFQCPGLEFSCAIAGVD